MRFLATMIFTAALALPALAQPGRGGPGGRPGEGQNSQAEVEKLKQTVKELEAKLKAAKEGKKEKDEEKDEKKDKKEESKKPEPKKEEAKKPEPQRGEQRGEGFRGPPMGGFQGRGGPGGPMGGGMNFPGMNNLTPDEQATFRKLMAKMTGQSQTEDRKPEPKQPDRKPEGSAAKNPAPKQPNLEERMERLEKMMQELMRSQRSR